MAADPDQAERAGKERGLNVGPLVRRYLELLPQRQDVQRRLAELWAARRRAARGRAAAEAVDAGGAGDRDAGPGPSWGSRSELDELRWRVAELDAQARDILLNLPNLPEAQVPPGGDRSHDRVLKEVGGPGGAPRPARPHGEVAAGLGWLSPVAGLPAAQTESRAGGGAVLCGDGPALARALEDFLLHFHRRHGYREVRVPALLGEADLLASGHLPYYRELMYRLEGGRGWLAPSTEPGLLGRLRGQVLRAPDLPLCWVAAGPCFRLRISGRGRGHRGFVRLHQFREARLLKVLGPGAGAPPGGEPAASGGGPEGGGQAPGPLAELQVLVGHVEEVLRLLDLPYRVVVRCAGRLSFAAALVCDLEAWMPSRKEYLSLSSCSWYGDFQARRGNIRAGEGPGRRGRPGFVRTLSASALPLERCLAALLENHQQEDGSVILPEALRPFWGGAAVLEPPERARP